VLETKNNEAIANLFKALNTINSLAPPPAQVEDAEMIVKRTEQNHPFPPTKGEKNNTSELGKEES
jgi:hypothetical protein